MNDWIIRIMNEAHHNVHSWFVTLTYRDADLPINDEGESLLVKRDLQLWLKRLRKKFSVRYYAVGEYGTKFGRAHYHVILFSNQIITHETITSTWQHGHTHVGNLTPKSAAYTAKYVFQQKGDYKGRTPPFALMSRRPGIGSSKIPFLPKRYYCFVNGHKKRLPRYYKDKMFTREDKIQMREKTLLSVERLYRADLAYLQEKGYTDTNDAIAEYIERGRIASTKKIYVDKSKLRF